MQRAKNIIALSVKAGVGLIVAVALMSCAANLGAGPASTGSQATAKPVVVASPTLAQRQPPEADPTQPPQSPITSLRQPQRNVTVPVPAGATESQFRIRISGTSGIEFQGAYVVVQQNGQVANQVITGQTPADYSVIGAMVSVSLQKLTSRNDLITVEIWQGNEVVAAGETTAPYGLVTAAAP